MTASIEMCVYDLVMENKGKTLLEFVEMIKRWSYGHDESIAYLKKNWDWFQVEKYKVNQ